MSRLSMGLWSAGVLAACAAMGAALWSGRAEPPTLEAASRDSPAEPAESPVAVGAPLPPRPIPDHKRDGEGEAEIPAFRKPVAVRDGRGRLDTASRGAHFQGWDTDPALGGDDHTLLPEDEALGGPFDEWEEDPIQVTMDHAFAAQVVDEDWAAEGEGRIRAVLAEHPKDFEGAAIECRSTLCRVDLPPPAEPGSGMNLQWAATMLAGDFSEGFWSRAPDGTQSLYMVRPGRPFPAP